MEGTIRRINFEEGTRVRRGQILVQIDDSELQPNIQKLQAQLATAKEEYSRKKQFIVCNLESQRQAGVKLAYGLANPILNMLNSKLFGLNLAFQNSSNYPKYGSIIKNLNPRTPKFFTGKLCGYQLGSTGPFLSGVTGPGY